METTLEFLTTNTRGREQWSGSPRWVGSRDGQFDWL